MNYEELVKALRSYSKESTWCASVVWEKLMLNAADAIEALQVELAISKGAIRILDYNIEQMREDSMKLIEKEMARLKREVQDESISKFIDGEW